MDEDTTTGAVQPTDGGNEPQMINGVAVDDSGQALPVPDEAETDTSADTATSNPPQETPTEPTETGVNETVPETGDAKLKSFAKGQGIDNVDELTAREKSLLKSAYDNKAAFDRSKAGKLGESANITAEQLDPNITPEQRDNVRIRNMELRMEAQTWKQNNPDKLDLELSMSQMLVDDPNKRLLVQEGYLSLDELYYMAKGQSPGTDQRAEGKREALESLRDKQQASVPRGNAVNGTPGESQAITPQNVDQLVGQHDLNWFNEHQAEINRALAG